MFGTRTNIKFAKKHGMSREAFKNLPETHKAALIWHLAVDNDEWGMSPNVERTLTVHADSLRKGYNAPKSYCIAQNRVKDAIHQSIEFYDNKYGRENFGVANIPRQAIIDELMQRDNEIHYAWADFKTYHKWYVETEVIPQHTEVWPVILSCWPHEVIGDGFHRFHQYCISKLKVIPCIA